MYLLSSRYSSICVRMRYLLLNVNACTCCFVFCLFCPFACLYSYICYVRVCVLYFKTIFIFTVFFSYVYPLFALSFCRRRRPFFSYWFIYFSSFSSLLCLLNVGWLTVRAHVSKVCSLLFLLKLKIVFLVGRAFVVLIFTNRTNQK